jgi:hypothetical protein
MCPPTCQSLRFRTCAGTALCSSQAPGGSPESLLARSESPPVTGLPVATRPWPRSRLGANLAWASRPSPVSPLAGHSWASPGHVCRATVARTAGGRLPGLPGQPRIKLHHMLPHHSSFFIRSSSETECEHYSLPVARYIPVPVPVGTQLATCSGCSAGTRWHMQCRVAQVGTLCTPRTARRISTAFVPKTRTALRWRGVHVHVLPI